MRTKTHWFQSETARHPEEVGRAAAVRAWRGATSAVRTLAEDGPITDRSGGHLALVQELLLFAVQYTDRMTWLRGLEQETRRRLVEAMIKRLADGVGENAGDREAGNAFLARAGERLDEYAGVAYRQEDPGFPAYNILGARGCQTADRPEDLWLHGRLAEVEGPELIADLRPVVDGLLANLQAEAGGSSALPTG